MKAVKGLFKLNEGNVDRTVPFVLCSKICRNVKMWSMHGLPLLNPACSWRRIVSVATDILFRIMRLKILHVIENTVMPRQLLQFPKSPFSGSLIIVPVFQSSGVSFSSHILLKIWHRIVHLLSAFLRRHCRNLVLFQSSGL